MQSPPGERFEFLEGVQNVGMFLLRVGRHVVKLLVEREREIRRLDADHYRRTGYISSWSDLQGLRAPYLPQRREMMARHSP